MVEIPGFERAIAKQHISRKQVVGGHAVQDRMRPGGIVADHAAEGSPFCRGRVWAKHQAVLRSSLVERGQHDARLHKRCAGIRVDLDDRIEPTGAIDDQGRTDGLPAQRGTSTAWQDGNLVSGSKLHRGDQILLCTRNGHAQWFDLIHGRIGAIQNFGSGVGANFPGKPTVQFMIKILGEGHVSILIENSG